MQTNTQNIINFMPSVFHYEPLNRLAIIIIIIIIVVIAVMFLTVSSSFALSNKGKSPKLVVRTLDDKDGSEPSLFERIKKFCYNHKFSLSMFIIWICGLLYLGFKSHNKNSKRQNSEDSPEI